MASDKKITKADGIAHRPPRRFWVTVFYKAVVASWLSLMAVAYWVKYLRLPPKLYLAGLQNTELADMAVSQRSINFRLPLNITVYNPNFLSVHLESAEISGRLQGTEPSIFITHVYNRTLTRHGNTTFTQMVDFAYNVVTDEGMRVMGDLIAKCKSSPTSPPLVIDYLLVARYTALGFRGLLRQNEVTHLVCPLNMVHVTVQGSLDSIHKHSHSFIVGSLGIVEEAMDVTMHMLGGSFDLFRAFRNGGTAW